MEKQGIIEKVKEIFADILDNPEINLSDTTTANEVEGWDSLSHIQIVVALEREFKIRFTSREIQSWTNVGEMVDCIKNKIP
jgi:acyl carrier protein